MLGRLHLLPVLIALRRSVPGPKGQLFVGDVLEYERDRHGWLVRTREEFGDVVRLAPGVVVVHDPDLIHEALAGTNEIFFLDSALIAGRRSRRALIANIPQWMQIRRHTWHSMDRRMVSAHLERLRVALTEG